MTWHYTFILKFFNRRALELLRSNLSFASVRVRVEYARRLIIKKVNEAEDSVAQQAGPALIPQPDFIYSFLSLPGSLQDLVSRMSSSFDIHDLRAHNENVKRSLADSLACPCDRSRLARCWYPVRSGPSRLLQQPQGHGAFTGNIQHCRVTNIRPSTQSRRRHCIRFPCALMPGSRYVAIVHLACVVCDQAVYSRSYNFGHQRGHKRSEQPPSNAERFCVDKMALVATSCTVFLVCKSLIYL